MTSKTESWASKWGLIIAGIGMAVGCGNIWRFPRIAAKYGGSTFIIAWLIALFVWSLPILMMEMAMGKTTRKGPVGAFAIFLGKKFTWMGSWVACVTLAICFYYSVVTGWCLKYASLFVMGLPQQSSAQIWQEFTESKGPIIFHIIALLIGASIVLFGVCKGIEKANKIFLPLLFAFLVFLACKAIAMPGGREGVHYFLLRFNLQDFQNPALWLEAFAQSAWSTGAGWGLWLTYSVYAKSESNTCKSSLLVGVGNNLASILAGLVVIPTIFATVSSVAERTTILTSNNQGLTFIHLVTLFKKIPGGNITGFIFFIALFLAALSSLLALLELGVRVLMDTGLTRFKAVSLITVIALIGGIPSSINMKTFNSQDWVWGVGLLVSGLFFALAAILKGVEKIRQNYLFTNNKGLWWKCFICIIPFICLGLLGWWFYQSTQWEKLNWWDPSGTYTPGNVICQWGILLFVVIIFNNYIAKVSLQKERE